MAQRDEAGQREKGRINLSKVKMKVFNKTSNFGFEMGDSFCQLND